MLRNLAWDGDWTAIESSGEAKRAEKELHREMPLGHALFGRGAVAAARRRQRQRDDFLFQLDDGSFAQVHLTRQAESDPGWPDAAIFSSSDAWKAIPPQDR